MLLDVYTPAFIPSGNIEAFSSLQWTRKWHGIGAFELHAPMREDIAFDDLVVYGEEAGIIESIHKEKAVGGEELVLSGPLLAGYISRRIIWGTQTITGDPECVMKQLIQKNMGSSAAADRQFSNFTIEADQGLSGESLDYQETDVKLDGEIETLSEDSGLGYDIKFGGTGMIFRVLEGLDRTEGQSTNDRAVFSADSENILSAEFDYNGKKYTNLARVASDAYEETVGAATGYERREVFVKPSNVEKDENGNANSEATQRALMQQQGTQKLTDIDVALTIKVNPYSNLTYKDSYDLGDICTVKVEDWGISMDARIVEIKEVHELSGTTLEITFGTGKVTFEKTIRRISNG